ncbi:MAG TPA: hypothetical protein VEF36_05280, partial [Roseiarcus sp.]|nr:hypothetical protein [Roseiarcus sp.]
FEFPRRRNLHVSRNEIVATGSSFRKGRDKDSAARAARGSHKQRSFNSIFSRIGHSVFPGREFSERLLWTC